MAFLAVLKCTPVMLMQHQQPRTHFTKAVAQKSSSAAPNLGRSTLLIFYSSGAHHCFTRQMNFDHISIKEWRAFYYSAARILKRAAFSSPIGDIWISIWHVLIDRRAREVKKIFNNPERARGPTGMKE
jgi:hypothetical protein